MKAAKKISFFHTVLMSITFLAFGLWATGVGAETKLKFSGGVYYDGSLSWHKINGKPYTYHEAKDFCEHAVTQQSYLSGWRLPTRTEIETFYLNNLRKENANVQRDIVMITGLKNWYDAVWSTSDEKNDTLYYAFFLGQGSAQGCYEGKPKNQQEPSCFSAHQAFCVTDEKIESSVIWFCPDIEDLKNDLKNDIPRHRFWEKCSSDSQNFSEGCVRNELSGRLTSNQGGSVEIIDKFSTEPFDGKAYPASSSIYMRNNSHLSCIYSSSKVGTRDFILTTNDKAIIGKSCTLVGGQVEGSYCNGGGCAIKCPLD